MNCVDCLFCDKLLKPILGISYNNSSAEVIKEFAYTHECRLHKLYLKDKEKSCQDFIEKEDEEQLEELREIIREEREGNNEIYYI